MPKVSLSQQNFNGGEYSLGLKQRFDLQAYYNGVERMDNFFPTKEGNAKYRTGTVYQRTTKSNNSTRLLPFVTSNTNRFLLEFSNLVLRIFKDGVQVGSDIASPYRTVDLFNIHIAQEKSIAILVDGVHPPYRLTGISSFTLALELFNYEANTAPPFLSENLTAITITNSATTGTITLTASAALFNSLDVGRYVKVRDPGGVFGFVRITVFTNTTLVTGVVTKTLPAAAAYSTWSFSPLPTTVAFYEQRLIYGQFNKIWFSKVPDDNGIVRYNDFTLGTGADDALTYESGLLRGEIQWIVGNDKILAIGTYTGVFKADSGETNEPISPTTPPTIKQISNSTGTSNILPLQKDNVIFFVSRDLKIVYSLFFSFENDGHVIEDRMLLSNNIAKEGITQLDFFEGGVDILFATKTNGELVGMVFDPQQQVNGWFRFNSTNGLVESVTSVPRSNGEDRFFLSIKRVINSATVRYIEYFSDEITFPLELDYYSGDKDTDRTDYLFASWEAQKDFDYLDSSLQYDGSDQSVTMTPSAVTGLDITFTASGALFASSDVDRQIWEKLGTGRAVITSYTSTTVVKCNIISDFVSTSAIAAGDWYLTSDTFTGLSHLEGQELNIIRDGGKDEETYTVASGSITISQQASKITAGLFYRGLIKTMGLEGGSANGTSRAKSKLVNKFGIYVLNTVDVKIGTDIYDLNQALFGPGEILGRPITAETGIRELDLPERYETEKHIYIIQDSPLPCTIQAILPLMEANDR